MRPESYIGITGFTSQDQINAVINDALPADTDRLVMAGLLVSNRTMRGETNKWPHRYPRPEALGKVFSRRDNLLNLIHFNTKDPDKLLDDMCAAQDMVGPNCDGFQLNVAWPDPDVLEQYRANTRFRRRVIVLQCGAGAIEKAGSPFTLGLRLRNYDGLIDYVLIDPSGGHGKNFQETEMREMLYCIYDNSPESIGIGVAGGLHPENLERLRPLLEEFEFSIDAEGKLRDEGDQLDQKKAVQYLQTADRIFRECGQTK